jgi:hypothetical protein
LKSEISKLKSQIAALMIGAATTASPLLAQTGGRKPAEPKIAERPGVVRGDEITPEQQRTVEKGLEYLASRQQADGSFGSQGAGFGATSAITGLAGLAFMQAGNLPAAGSTAKTSAAPSITS